MAVVVTVVVVVAVVVAMVVGPGGDCHWLCICIFGGLWVNILFYWVRNIILRYRIEE